MQGIGYTFKVWLSGIFLTPVVYSLLLTLFSGFQLPLSIGRVIFTLVLPYTVLISIWVALGIFATIILNGNHRSLKVRLSLTDFTMSFAGLAMVHYIPALMSYNGDYLLALAYAISTLIFIWLYKPNLSGGKLNRGEIIKTVKYATIYGLTVWLFTFLFSTPVSIITWIITKDYKSVSTVKTALNILERYHIQLNLSVAYFVTIFLTSLIVINLNMAESRKKLIILLFAFPLTFPALFYYLLFSGDIYTYSLNEIIMLTAPSIVVSAVSIWLIAIVPAPKTIT
jgi:hypothetical protein